MTTNPPTQPTSTAQDALVFAEGALALAGHKVTDPTLRMLLERHARGEISDEQALAAARQHIQGQ